MIINLVARLKYRAIILMAVLCFIQKTASAQQYFDLAKNHKRATMPFRLIRNMMIVEVNINGKGPFNFILDSGVGVMIITEPTLLDSLNINNKRLIKISGLGNNEEYDAYVASSLNVTMDDDDIFTKDISAAIFTTDHFGLSNYAGIPIHGLLGYEFFNSFAVKINFNDSTLTVGAPKDIRVFRHGSKLPLTIEEHKPYITTRVVLPNGNAAENKLIVDLGAGHPLLLENLLKQNEGLPDKFIEANLGVGLTGPINGYLSRVKEVDLGKYKLKDMITSFPDIHSNRADSLHRDGNLGIGIIKKFNLIIDYPDNVMYIKDNNLFNAPYEHDMSGLEYYRSGDDLKHVIISRVERGSAADEIGLLKDDEIIGINFKSVQGMSLEDIDNMFKSHENRSLLLEIYRKGVYDKLIMTLKRRI